MERWSYYVDNDYFRDIVVEDEENDVVVYEYFNGLSRCKEYAVVFNDRMLAYGESYERACTFAEAIGLYIGVMNEKED